jgi:hypothetical protein
MIAIQLNQDCTELLNAALQKKLLINITGRSIRLLPPLIINQTEANIIINTIVSSTLSAVLQTSGLPPKVEPCVPGVNKVAALPLAKHTPIGTPLPNPFAKVSTSGCQSTSGFFTFS